MHKNGTTSVFMRTWFVFLFGWTFRIRCCDVCSACCCDVCSACYCDVCSACCCDVCSACCCDVCIGCCCDVCSVCCCDVCSACCCDVCSACCCDVCSVCCCDVCSVCTYRLALTEAPLLNNSTNKFPPLSKKTLATILPAEVCAFKLFSIVLPTAPV